MENSFILYIILTAIACVFHIIGTYFYKLYDNNVSNFPKIFILSIIFGAFASIIRVPTNIFLGKKLNVVFMEVLYLFLLFITTTLYSSWILNEKIKIHTYIIVAVIISLIVLNDYLSNK